MTNRGKGVLATVLLLAAAALFAWYAAGGGDRIERGYPSVLPEDRVIPLEEAPEPVQATARGAVASGGGVIEDVTLVHHVGGGVSYDLDILRGGRKIEMKIDADGKVIEKPPKKKGGK